MATSLTLTGDFERSDVDGIDQRVKGYGSNPLGGFIAFMFAE